MYRYVVHLKEFGSATTASSFIQAWNFLHHSIGLLAAGEILSSRVRGAARASLANKRPLQQSLPLSVKMIVALENVLHFAPYNHWKVIAGHFLMCLGSCSRFGDTMQVVSLKVTTFDDIQLVEGESKSFKTAHSEERRLKLLPIVSLGRFFGREAWGQAWFDLRASEGLEMDPALPAFSEITQSWLKRRMTTGEAALYLKEFLVSSGFKLSDLDHIGCHSLKTTFLSWTAKTDYLGVQDRLLMGHHISRENQSVVAYSRDELARIMVVIHKMLRDVKSHSFKPDASRAERIADASRDDPAMMPEAGLSDSESDADVEFVAPALFPKQDRPSWDDLPIGMINRMHVHNFSGVVHIASERDSKTLVCGRVISRNFAPIQKGANFYDLPVCMQCRPTN